MQPCQPLLQTDAVLPTLVGRGRLLGPAGCASLRGRDTNRAKFQHLRSRPGASCAQCFPGGEEKSGTDTLGRLAFCPRCWWPRAPARFFFSAGQSRLPVRSFHLVCGKRRRPKTNKRTHLSGMRGLRVSACSCRRRPTLGKDCV